MLFSEEWLRHYINPALSSDELCETLTMGGLEVEGAEPIAPAFTGVIVAQVLTCDQHPNADKLHVCTVDIGKGADGGSDGKGAGGVEADDEQRSPDGDRHGVAEDEDERRHDRKAAADPEEAGQQADPSRGEDEARHLGGP